MANGSFILRAARIRMLGDLYWKAADGTGEAEKLASSPGRGLFPWSWSKDGKTLVLWELTLTPPQADIGMLSMEGDHARKPLLQEKYIGKRSADFT